MSFLNVVKQLLPKTKPWNLSSGSTLRGFFSGLSKISDDIQKETELAYFDLFPDSTRAMQEWENQFQVLFADEKFGDARREILRALWQSNRGGQTAQYLQKFLRNIDERICVTENVPLRSPTDANVKFFAACGGAYAVCGNQKAICGAYFGQEAVNPYIISNNSQQEYVLNTDRKFWENCFFVSGEVIRDGSGKIIRIDVIEIDSKWKKFVDYLILKIKPAQTSALIYIKWV